MLVIISRSSINEVLRDLLDSGSVCVPSSVVPSFVAFCESVGLYPLGGALVQDQDGVFCQWLYL